MKIIWLQDFITVARFNSFSVAAEELYSSQSNVSKHIKLLETELGVKLFQRENRSVRLTDAGQALLAHAMNVISAYEAMYLTAQSYNAGTLPEIQIASVPIMHMYDLQKILIEFQKTRPWLKLKVTECDMPSVIAKMQRSSNTIGIFRQCAVRCLPSGVKWKIIPFKDDELVLLCGRNHPFAAKPSVSVAECLKENVVVLNTGMSEYALLLESLGYNPDSFHPVINFSASTAMCSYVSKGYGVSIIARNFAAMLCNSGDIVWRTFDEHPGFPLIVAVRDKLFTHEMQILIDRIIDSASE